MCIIRKENSCIVLYFKLEFDLDQKIIENKDKQRRPYMYIILAGQPLSFELYIPAFSVTCLVAIFQHLSFGMVFQCAV